MLKELDAYTYAEDLWDFEEVPVKINSITAFYSVEGRKRTIKKEFLEVNIGQKFAVYSPYSKRYYMRELHDKSELKPLMKYIKDANMWLLLTEEDKEKQAKLLKKLALHSLDQYTRLVELNLRLEATHEQLAGREGYITSVHELEREIKLVKNEHNT